MKPILLILDDWEGQIANNECWDNLKDVVDIHFSGTPFDEISDSILEKVNFLMTIRERTALTRQVFDRMPNLKLVLQTGGHAYHIDQTEAEKRGITIALGRKVKAPLLSVPELSIAMMLSAVHLLPQAHHAMRNSEWPLLTGRTLSNRRLGILGMGRHGTRVANIAKNAFNMDVVAWARPGGNSHEMDIPRLPLEELLRTSDIISIHLRLSPESKGLISAEKINLMKQGSVLINTSRGDIVEEPALINALKSNHLAGAGLDVFASEPLPADSPLRSMNNVVLTPHIGWTVEEVFNEFAQIACIQMQQYMNGNLPDSELLAHALGKH